jgi:hypothetical protein
MPQDEQPQEQLELEPQPTEDIEQRAREMGWMPPNVYKGPGKALSAEEFVERGEKIIPFLKANNQKLQDQIGSLKSKLESVQRNTQEGMEALKLNYQESLKRHLEEQREKLKAELTVARQEGDVDKEVEIQDKLSELRANNSNRLTSAPAAASQQALDPSFQTWMLRNPWYGNDVRKSKLAEGLGNIIRSDPDNDGVTGEQFFRLLDQELDKRTRPAPVSKVSGGSLGTSGGASGGGGKSYRDLPADAQAACDTQARKMVGPNRIYKDEQAWRKAYAKIYFEDEGAN